MNTKNYDSHILISKKWECFHKYKNVRVIYSSEKRARFRPGSARNVERNHLFAFVRNSLPLIHDTSSQEPSFPCHTPRRLIREKWRNTRPRPASWEKAERRIRTAIRQTSTLLNLKQLRSPACQLNISFCNFVENNNKYQSRAALRFLTCCTADSKIYARKTGISSAYTFAAEC
jgi:hypothetical protein